MTRVYVRRPAIHRVLEKVEVDPTTDCWIVKGMYVRPEGYIGITVGKGKTEFAHRISYEFFHGEVPTGLDVDHTCHNESDCTGGPSCVHRRCVNPKHLRASSRSENVGSGRGPQAARDRAAAMTHCKNGHELIPSNVYVTKNGASTRRRCKTCLRKYVRTWESRKRAS